MYWTTFSSGIANAVARYRARRTGRGEGGAPTGHLQAWRDCGERASRACYVDDVATISKADLLKLDVAARLELIEEIWESIASDDAAARELPLTESERAMLDERVREYRADPKSGQPWAEARAEILKQR